MSSFVSIRHADALFDSITACGSTPPTSLTALVDAYRELSNVGIGKDPTTALIDDVVAGLRGKSLEERISAARAAVQDNDFRAGLKQRVERPLLKRFVEVLDDEGAADDIITALTPAFNSAATQLAECAELVDANTDAETFLASATAKQIKAWQAIDEHVAVLTKISTVVGHFGPHSTSFPLSEIPTITSGGGFINNNGVMCVDPQWGLVRGCQLFIKHGTHRNSPWFKGASVLKLNSIAETREKIRAWAETSWEALGVNAGAGHFDDRGEFVAATHPNPYAVKETEPA